jgi:pimeloyl-ACP methyl ester carboxylesterase
MNMQGKRIEVGGLDFNVVDQGSGPAVLLLHGFPDSSYLWRHQIPALVEAGFRVIAPDLRGFGESAKPTAVEGYALPILFNDVTGILDALDVGQTHVVGHDWGAPLAWLLASLTPERVERLVAMSVGHPSSFRDPPVEQREKSWYMLLFQFEGIPEQLLSRDDWRLFRGWTRNHPELEKWIKDLARPGALTAALNWYRANVHPRTLLEEAPPLPPVQAPTLGLWSTGDAYLTEELMIRSEQYVAGSWHYERVENASHWMQLDAPERISERLVTFLRG